MAKLSKTTRVKEASRSPGNAGIERWRTAQRWRRLVDTELASADLTLTRWLLLEATDALTRESGNAVSQRAVADRAEFDAMTVSQVMRGLEERGWVDRGPSPSGPAYRIVVTASGRTAVAEGRARIEAASARGARPAERSGARRAAAGS
jgi:MarR family transcriptional regulator, organic hydroperoxide resistance regulator